MNKYGLFSDPVFSFWHADCFNINKTNTKPTKKTPFNLSSIFTPGSSRRSAALHIKNFMKGGDGKEDRRQERRKSNNQAYLKRSTRIFKEKPNRGQPRDGKPTGPQAYFFRGRPGCLLEVKPNFNF